MIALIFVVHDQFSGIIFDQTVIPVWVKMLINRPRGKVSQVWAVDGSSKNAFFGGCKK